MGVGGILLVSYMIFVWLVYGEAAGEVVLGRVY